jgi:hypothetical protein
LEMDFVDTQLSIKPAKDVGCAACPQIKGFWDDRASDG